jgi:hypothetical protein
LKHQGLSGPRWHEKANIPASHKLRGSLGLASPKGIVAEEKSQKVEEVLLAGLRAVLGHTPRPRGFNCPRRPAFLNPDMAPTPLGVPGEGNKNIVLISLIPDRRIEGLKVV